MSNVVENHKTPYFEVYMREEDDTHTATIKILSGDYAGYEFKYGEVSVGEEDANGDVALQFEYTVVEGNALTEGTQEIRAFENQVAAILQDLILEVVEDSLGDEDDDEDLSDTDFE